MRIGVLSDTHIRNVGKELPEPLVRGFQGVDLILHAGDWMSMEVAYLLGEIAPVDGVAGNNDGWDIVDRFGFQKVLELSGFRIGIVHGHQGYKQTALNASDAFKDEQVDVIVFGHSHIPYQATFNDVLLFNPGSPTDKRSQPQYSYGILELNTQVKAELFYF